MSENSKEGGRGIASVEKQTKAAEKEGGRQQHKDYVQIVRSLDGISHQLKANEKLDNASDKKRASRECLTIILLLFTAAVALAGDVIFYWTMVDAGRGWIGVTDAYKTDESTKLGHVITLNLYLSNSGHGPAEDTKIVTIGEKVGFVEINNVVDIGKLPKVGNTCDTATPKDGLPIIWPTPASSKGNPTPRSSDEDGGNVRYDADLLGGHALYRLRGCITYKTMGEKHRTWFCVLMAYGYPHIPYCADGNGAD